MGQLETHDPLPPQTDSAPPSADYDSMRHRSAWTFRQRVGRALWAGGNATILRYSPRVLFRWRSMLLRCFGAKIGAYVNVHPTVRIEVPWHLSIGDHSVVGHF